MRQSAEDRKRPEGPRGDQHIGLLPGEEMSKWLAQPPGDSTLGP